MQEMHGQNVIQLKKSEINLIVEAVGHLVQLKQCLIESVLHQDKLNKLECQQTIQQLAVVHSHVEMVVMVDIHLVLGHIGLKLVLLQVIFMTEQVANLIHQLLVIITLMEPYNLAHQLNTQHQHAQAHVKQVILPLIHKISILDQVHIVFKMLNKFNKKS